jgi:hypothetical protein
LLSNDIIQLANFYNISLVGGAHGNLSFVMFGEMGTKPVTYLYVPTMNDDARIHRQVCVEFTIPGWFSTG